MTFRRVLALLAVALLVISLAGCGDETANPGTETTVEAAENTPQPAPEALLQAISSSEEQGVGMKPVRGMIVRSKDFEKMYFVAMECSATKYIFSKSLLRTIMPRTGFIPTPCSSLELMACSRASGAGCGVCSAASTVVSVPGFAVSSPQPAREITSKATASKARTRRNVMV